MSRGSTTDHVGKAVLSPCGSFCELMHGLHGHVCANPASVVFAEYHQDFIATFEVVSAYRHCYDGLSKVWPKALYRQVVLLGNRSYLQLFLQHLPLTKDWLHAIVQLCVDEPCPEQFPSRMMRMKQFLREGVPNLETRYQLARELGSGFTDIAIETASSVYMT
eukprot:symbB.v1.2.011977.t1/scaffold788.1/size164690/14